MGNIKLNIFQGSEVDYPTADVNIVIDVIRAFTVSHISFLKEVREIFLVNTIEEAFTLRRENPTYLLAGELGGLPIANFDLDNSPHTIFNAKIANKSLVQKTSNGVKATLRALNAKTILVTGLSNARKTALYAKQLSAVEERYTINIIASHAGDDDDLACAEYIQDIIFGIDQPSVDKTIARIKNSRPAQKFLDPEQIDFNPKDLEYCTQEIECNFVMEVDKSLGVPRIVKRDIVK
jgi:2-phosphosulfolactate phosphatase